MCGTAGKTKVVENVWCINGKMYDLTEFVSQHPGGETAVMNAAGHPHGEYFVESYHPNPDTVYQLLKKYELKGPFEAIHPINNEFESSINYTFEEKGFYRTLKKDALMEVRKECNNLKGKMNWRGDLAYVLVDTLHLLLLGYATYQLILGNFFYAFVAGFLRATNIMRIAHVASHASLSPWPTLNTLYYYISMMFAGTTPEIWSRKHVVRHHVNTNEDGLDEDRMEPLKCVAEGLPFLNLHRYQHIYMWAFYVHVVAAWSLSDLLGNTFRANAGTAPFTRKQITLNLFTLLVHMLITYVLPIYVCGWWGLLLIEVNTLLTSTVFGFEFIVNHEISGCDIYQECKGKAVDWGKYQTISSADFHPAGWGSWLFNQITGGLNLQICHHLFPGVHYRHYPTLTRVIYEHCEKHGIKPCHSDTVVDAVTRHYDFLKECSLTFDPATKKSQ